jgi:hypothetical protein
MLGENEGCFDGLSDGFLLGEAVGFFVGCLDGAWSYKESAVGDLFLESCAIRN